MSAVEGLFPVLLERRDQTASTLSGGERADARHRPGSDVRRATPHDRRTVARARAYRHRANLCGAHRTETRRQDASSRGGKRRAHAGISSTRYTCSITASSCGTERRPSLRSVRRFLRPIWARTSRRGGISSDFLQRPDARRNVRAQRRRADAVVGRRGHAQHVAGRHAGDRRLRLLQRDHLFGPAVAAGPPRRDRRRVRNRAGVLPCDGALDVPRSGIRGEHHHRHCRCGDRPRKPDDSRVQRLSPRSAVLVTGRLPHRRDTASLPDADQPRDCGPP